MLSSDSALLLLTTNFQDVRQITRLKRLFFFWTKTRYWKSIKIINCFTHKKIIWSEILKNLSFSLPFKNFYVFELKALYKNYKTIQFVWYLIYFRLEINLILFFTSIIFILEILTYTRFQEKKTKYKINLYF